jgi:putative FmdB family regulatory protein
MAVYEFECKSCGKHFEVSVPISEHDRLKKRPPKCPRCGKSPGAAAGLELQHQGAKQVLIWNVGDGSQFNGSNYHVG